MKKGMLLAIIGAVMVVVGIFLPIVKFPGGTQALYFNGGDIYGSLTLIIAILAGVMALLKLRSMVLISGLAALGIIVTRMITIIRDLPNEDSLRTQLKNLIDSNVPGSAGEGIANAIGGPQLHWLGWIVLLVGGVLILISAFVSTTERV